MKAVPYTHGAEHWGGWNDLGLIFFPQDDIDRLPLDGFDEETHEEAVRRIQDMYTQKTAQQMPNNVGHLHVCIHRIIVDFMQKILRLNLTTSTPTTINQPLNWKNLKQKELSQNDKKII